MRLVVLADTHLTERSSRRLPARAIELLDGADAIVHAGDVTTAPVLTELARFAPVHAVLGNNDVALRGALPEVLELELGGVAVAIVHDSGPRRGREARLARRFPRAGLVVFGHSHVPLVAEGVEGKVLVNPGSPTQRRAQPHHTVAVVELVDGSVVAADLVVVDP